MIRDYSGTHSRPRSEMVAVQGSHFVPTLQGYKILPGRSLSKRYEFLSKYYSLWLNKTIGIDRACYQLSG
jgi:hypothetical protein